MWAEVDGERKKVAWYVISLSLPFPSVLAFALPAMAFALCTNNAVAFRHIT
jgi:hypothetical protein